MTRSGFARDLIIGALVTTLWVILLWQLGPGNAFGVEAAVTIVCWPLVVVFAARDKARIRRRLTILLVVMFVGALLLVAIQLRYTIRIPSGVQRGPWLIGLYVLRPEMLGGELRGLPLESQILRLGASRIPHLYGWTLLPPLIGHVVTSLIVAISGILMAVVLAPEHRAGKRAATHMPQQKRVTILFLAANPTDSTHLHLDEEIRAIEERLNTARHKDKFQVKQRWAVRMDDLSQALLKEHPVIVHFSGHGSAQGQIIVTTVDGHGEPLSPTAVAGLFGILKDSIQCVVLNACYSDVQARAIAQHIPCVIGTSQAIGDEAAIRFACGFYRGLAFGRSVKTAFDLGCNEIGLANLPDVAVPRLHTRPGIDAREVHLA